MRLLWRAETERGFYTICKSEKEFYLIPPRHPAHPRSSYGRAIGRLEDLEAVLRAHGDDGSHVVSPFRSGEYHPRIWRGDESPKPEETEQLAAAVTSIRMVRLLLAKLRDLFAYVEPARLNDPAFGIAQRELLILACTEVEAAWRSVLVANGAVPRRGADRWTTEDYVKLIDPHRLTEWSVTISVNPAYGSITPFEAWDPDRPTASLCWYSAYNAVKHDRERNLEQATFGAVVNAMAAAFVMTVAQFGSDHLGSVGLLNWEEFRIARLPKWSIDEAYVPPNRDPFSGGWLGFERWTQRNCVL